MKQEEKQLLLQDLCARLPYGTIVRDKNNPTSVGKLVSLDMQNKFATFEVDEQTGELYTCPTEFVIPYLRPMSSMTKKEQEKFVKFHCVKLCPIVITDFLSIENEAKMIDWLNAHQFDYRKTSDGKTMIEAGLALEAPDGMYS